MLAGLRSLGTGVAYAVVSRLLPVKDFIAPDQASPSARGHDSA